MVKVLTADDNLSPSKQFMVAHSGPPASLDCEPRQARKGAAAAIDVSAGMWLRWAAAFPSGILFLTPIALFSLA